MTEIVKMSLNEICEAHDARKLTITPDMLIERLIVVERAFKIACNNLFEAEACFFPSHGKCPPDGDCGKHIPAYHMEQAAAEIAKERT